MSAIELRYVVLFHDGIDEPHFDLMFETSADALLQTWRSASWPITAPTPLVKLGDHRRDYLEYEGPLSSGRGNVKRIESGTYVASPERDEPYCIAIALRTPAWRHLWMLCPPDHEWSIEPAV